MRKAIVVIKFCFSTNALCVSIAHNNTIGGLQQEFILEAYALGQKQNPIILKSK